MKKYFIKLTDPEKGIIKSTLESADVFGVRNRALILRFSDKGLKDKEIADLLEVTVRTVCNVRKYYYTKGLGKALSGESRPGRPKKFDKKDEAELIALSCSNPPEGHDRWTLELLRENMSKPIGKSMVHLMLKKTNSNHG